MSKAKAVKLQCQMPSANENKIDKLNAVNSGRAVSPFINVSQRAAAPGFKDEISRPNHAT
jgi:hypothetical protein